MDNNQVYFKGIKEKIIEYINFAEFEILIAIAWFTDKEIIKHLEKRAKQKIKIEIIIYDDKINNKDFFRTLYNSGVKIYLSKKLMHNKMCIIDENIIINGSYNWTLNAKTNNENIQVTIGNKQINNSFISEFNQLKSKCENIDYYFDNSRENIIELNELFPSFYSMYAPERYPFFYFKEFNNTEFKKGIYLITNKDEEIVLFKKIYFQKNKVNLNLVKQTLDLDFIPLKIFGKVLGLTITDGQIIKLSKDKYVVRELKVNNFKADLIFQIDKKGNVVSEKKYPYYLLSNDNFLIKDNDSFSYISHTNFEQKKLDFNVKIVTEYLIITFDNYSKYRKFKIFDLNGNILKELNKYSDCEKINENTINFIISPEFYVSNNRVYEYNNSDLFKKSYKSEIFSYEINTNKINLIKSSTEISKIDLNNQLFFQDSNDQKLYRLYKTIIHNNLNYSFSEKYFDDLKNRYLKNAQIYNESDWGSIAVDAIKKQLSIIEYDKRILKESQSKNCYIATHIYKDINHPKVNDFRNFRDNKLINYKIGILFIKYYYKFSPLLVLKLKNKNLTNYVIKKILNVLILVIKK